MCTMCSQGNPTTYCLQCHKKMCDNCLQRHNNSRSMSLHTILHMEDVKECGRHQEYCSHVCGDCRDLVCVSCLMSCCNTHDCKDIGEAARYYMDEGTSRTKIFVALRHIYEDLQNERTQVITNIQQEIGEHTAKLIALLEQKKRELRSLVASKKKDILQEVDELQQKDLQLVDRLRGVQPSSLQSGIPSTLLKLLPTLQAGSVANQSTQPKLTFTPRDDMGLGVLISIYKEADPPASPEHPVEDWPTFPQDIVFEKVVWDQLQNRDCLVAKYKNMIVRKENIDNRFGIGNISQHRFYIQILQRNVHKGYCDELGILERFPDVQNVPRHSQRIKFMAHKLWDHMRDVENVQEEGPFRFSKIVHDRRKFMNDLVGIAGDVIYRYDINSTNGTVFVRDRDQDFEEEKLVINRFQGIEEDWFVEDIVNMERNVQEYATRNGITLFYDGRARADANYYSNFQIEERIAGLNAEFGVLDSDNDGSDYMY